MLEEAELDVNRRTQQIARIAKAVNDIASAMHEMSVLIVDQGSILDRIDHNVESAIVDIKTGRDEVDSASKYQEKSTAVICIGLIIMIILIIAIVFIALNSS